MTNLRNGKWNLCFSLATTNKKQKAKKTAPKHFTAYSEVGLCLLFFFFFFSSSCRPETKNWKAAPMIFVCIERTKATKPRQQSFLHGGGALKTGKVRRKIKRGATRPRKKCGKNINQWNEQQKMVWPVPIWIYPNSKLGCDSTQILKKCLRKKKRNYRIIFVAFVSWIILKRNGKIKKDDSLSTCWTKQVKPEQKKRPFQMDCFNIQIETTVHRLLH